MSFVLKNTSGSEVGGVVDEDDLPLTLAVPEKSVVDFSVTNPVGKIVCLVKLREIKEKPSTFTLPIAHLAGEWVVSITPQTGEDQRQEIRFTLNLSKIKTKFRSTESTTLAEEEWGDSSGDEESAKKNGGEDYVDEMESLIGDGDED